MSRILVVNSGSSSLKYQLIELDGQTTLARGVIERIGEREVPDHTAAFQVMLDQLDEQGFDRRIPPDALGHRVVHGGERFVQPTIVTEAVKHEIDALSALAPLHNPPNLAGIVAAEATFPEIPNVAVFDTAFHQTLSPVSYSYAINARLTRDNHIRRYGFHGTSHQFVSAETAAFLDRPLKDLRLISLHIGNGASACAISGGKSVETSMGMTPLEGLMMGTRGGDIDPGVLIYLQRTAGLTVDQLDDLLNHGSGLLGLGGFGDIRDVQKAAEAGDEQSRLALEVYLHRIRSYVGAYLAQLGGADAIVFTAGVGENNAAVRADALAGMEWLGIRIDPERNESTSRTSRVVSTADAAISVLVIPTNEELEIARQTLAVIGG